MRADSRDPATPDFDRATAATRDPTGSHRQNYAANGGSRNYRAPAQGSSGYGSAQGYRSSPSSGRSVSPGYSAPRVADLPRRDRTRLRARAIPLRGRIRARAFPAVADLPRRDRTQLRARAIPLRGQLFEARASIRAAWRRIFRAEIVLGSAPELFCSAVVFGTARFRRWRIFRAEIVLSSAPELFRSAVVFGPARFRRRRIFRAEIVLGSAPELFRSAVVFGPTRFRRRFWLLRRTLGWKLGLFGSRSSGGGGRRR